MLTIVGGGSIGLITLAVLLEKGVKSKLYEASNRIGGLLRDIGWQDSNYFSGCQYLTINSQWFSSLPDYDLLRFNQKFVSYTDLFGKESISWEFSGPVYDGDLSLSRVRMNVDGSILNKISCYPSPIKEGLLDWLVKLGVDPKNFHAKSLKPLGISRVHIRSYDDKVQNWRKKDSVVSDYFGIPFTNHGSDLPAAIPLFGFSRYFDDNFYREYSESIITRTSVKINYEAENFVLKSNNASEIESGKILWSGNPNPILRSLEMGTLDSFNFRCQLICGEAENWNQEPFYVQVYSKSSKVLRIYLYKLDGISRFTVEKAFGDESIESTCKFVEELLEKLEIKVTLNPQVSKIQNRYNLFTLKDYESLVNLDLHLQSTNLISAGWSDYNRDSKIAAIVANIYE